MNHGSIAEVYPGLDVCYHASRPAGAGADRLNGIEQLIEQSADKENAYEMENVVQFFQFYENKNW